MASWFRSGRILLLQTIRWRYEKGQVDGDRPKKIICLCPCDLEFAVQLELLENVLLGETNQLCREPTILSKNVSGIWQKKPKRKKNESASWKQGQQTPPRSRANRPGQLDRSSGIGLVTHS
jgi:hypothetical protein